MKENSNIFPFQAFFFFSFFKSQPPYQVEKKRNGCTKGWCVGREFAARWSSAVQFQDVTFKDPKIKD